MPQSMAPIAFKVDLKYLWQHPSQSFPIVVALLFTDLFSAMAVLFAIGDRANLNDARGNLPKLKQALSVDAAAASGGALLGSTTAIIYLESAAGVEQGGRTGLVSIVVAVSFLLALFVTPLIAIIPTIATTSALVMIGIFMMQGIADLNLRDIKVASVALVTLLLMALTSASDGLAIGFVLYIAISIAAHEAKSIKPIAWILGVLFVLHYIF
jgi:AGZA family xanthine/uracil permease-like MFS transporter